MLVRERARDFGKGTGALSIRRFTKGLHLLLWSSMEWNPCTYECPCEYHCKIRGKRKEPSKDTLETDTCTLQHLD